MCLSLRDIIVNELRKTKSKLKEEIGLQFVHGEKCVAAYTDVEKHIRFLLKQPGIQGALSFPKCTMVVYDYVDEFRFLSWSSLCTGETSIQLKIVEPDNLLSLVLKIGKSDNLIFFKLRFLNVDWFTGHGI